MYTYMYLSLSLYIYIYIYDPGTGCGSPSGAAPRCCPAPRRAPIGYIGMHIHVYV